MSDKVNLFLDEICFLLESYKGRDKVLRVLCYLSRLIGECQTDGILAKKFSTFGSQMSATRATLRLLNDIPSLKNSLEYGLGKNEPDKYMANLGLAMNIIDQIFLPVEKVSWLAKYEILTGINTSQWDTTGSACWALSAYFMILKTFRYLFLIQTHSNCMTKIPMEKLHRIKLYHSINLIRLILDFIHAVNTLPPGVLWSSKLKSWHINVIATSSSMMGIYLIFYKKWMKL